MAGRMAQSLLPADDPFIRHALQFRGILVQLIKQKHFFFPDKQQKGIPHADPPQPILPYPGRYQRCPHLVILPSFLPGGPYLFICGGHCSFHSLSGQTGFPLKSPRTAFHRRAAGQLSAGIPTHAVRQHQYQCVLSSQNGERILLVTAGAQNLVPMQSGNQKRLLGKSLMHHGSK